MSFCFYKEDSGLPNERKWGNIPEKKRKDNSIIFLNEKFKQALKIKFIRKSRQTLKQSIRF